MPFTQGYTKTQGGTLDNLLIQLADEEKKYQVAKEECVSVYLHMVRYMGNNQGVYHIVAVNLWLLIEFSKCM